MSLKFGPVFLIHYNYTTGKENKLEIFPTPEQLWQRYKKAKELIGDELSEKVLTPYYFNPDKEPRYYQRIAINTVIQAILKGQRRVLITLATGTGKTEVAFQIAWKLWNAKWNVLGEVRKPKILFLSDRSVLVDDPKDKTFAPFGEARHKIEGEAKKSREIYFALYQSLAKDERRPGLYKEYSKDFFDLIIVDECHRGSASDDSNWREILEYFEPAYQFGMTATPLREDNKDTYKYFGNPVYTYTLKQGIEDGFLAPYKVYRIITEVDADGWQPVVGQVDRYNNEIPYEKYGTKDFGRLLCFRPRTEAVARHLTDFLKRTDRFAKTIIFCEDQAEAEEMRIILNNLNADLVKQYPDYVCRIVSDEGAIGRGHLGRFQELETITPVIVTTSKLLTTGVDVQMCRNIVLYKIVNSMTEFKQMIGRGTRMRRDYKKFYFNILDYTGSAVKRFSDVGFDGEPALLTQEEIDATGKIKPGTEKILASTSKTDYVQVWNESEPPIPYLSCEPRKYYVDEGDKIRIVADYEQHLSETGNKLKTVRYTDYTSEKVRSMFTSSAELLSKWKVPEERDAVISALAEKGISFEDLVKATGQEDADHFDLLCHVAYNAPLRSRRERAERLRLGKSDFFEKFSLDARQILNEILDKYIEYGTEQFKVPDILKIDPISKHGNTLEISAIFNGPENLKYALAKLQTLLYI